MQKKDVRIQKEKEEREAAEKAAAEVAEKARIAKETKKKKIRKAAAIIIPLIATVALLSVLIPKVIIPYIENASAYHDAEQLLSEGAYDDAKAAFEALGDFRGADNMAKEAVYQKADALNAAGEYEEAIAAWETIADYSDSAARIETTEKDWKEDDYQSALASLKNDDYNAAIGGFKALGTYKDSADLYLSTSYDYAVQLMDNKDYSMAIHYFNFIKGYKDADSLIKEADYQYGCQLLDEGKYQFAVTVFDNYPEYKDSETKINDAKFSYVNTHQDADRTAYYYLKDLISSNYSGAQEIYNDRYKWAVTVSAVNASENSMMNMPAISKFSPVYFHYVVSGGPFEGSIRINVRYTFPDGEEGTYNLGNVTRGEVGSLFWKQGIGATGRLSLRFYDGDGNKIGESSANFT